MEVEDNWMPQPDSTNHAPSGAKALRLFIAVTLPEEIREQVSGLSGNLQKGFMFTPNRPSWSGPNEMHITLLFMGATPEDMVPRIISALDRISGGFAPLRIEIKRLGVFPHWRSPSVLWTGVRERTHQILTLQKTLEQAMVGLGFTPEVKEYIPHLTLARFKSLKGAAFVEKLVNDHQGFKFGPFDAPEIVLFKSELNPAGAVHTALHRARLSAPPRVRVTEGEETENENE